MFDETNECTTIIAGFPVKIKTVARDIFDSGNERFYIEWEVWCANSNTEFLLLRNYGSHNEAQRAAEDILEAIRHFAVAIHNNTPPS